MDLAQALYRSEVKLRTNIMGEPAKHIRPLSETRYGIPNRRFSRFLTHVDIGRAIENGANFLAEGFLFTVAAGLILGETWRTSRNQTKRRDNVDDQLDTLGTKVVELNCRLNTLSELWETELRDVKQRYVVPPAFLPCISLSLSLSPAVGYPPDTHDFTETTNSLESSNAS